MSFIQKGITIEQLNKLSVNTLANSLGIEFIEIGDDFISAKIAVNIGNTMFSLTCQNKEKLYFPFPLSEYKINTKFKINKAY